ncbi:MAG: leucine--tRNA ligase [Candidatus Kinetoplastibacterium crithidii]|nr:leucine--tRNA ligase [Candidatus Kinetoplastibacterium crithidii]
MQEHYNHKTIESESQEFWEANKTYLTHENTKNKDGSLKPKFYACSMLPYPSGKLHMGHVRNYTINDVMARHKRMNGFNVLMPMGWDAFGMPAENAAIKSQIPPAKWTYNNINYMKNQMKSLGLSIDWTREICACNPSYYKWTQWLFLKMLDHGIVYRKTQVVNWDPIDQTVLANEQVIDGHGWRSGALVEKREIPGYYLAITNYAEELLNDLEDKLNLWPEKVKTMQANWIGKSEGLRFAFKHQIKDENNQLIQDGNLYVFTTRPDTIIGATFCAIATEHPISIYASKNNSHIKKFITANKLGTTTEAEISTKEKQGIYSGFNAIHPITNEKIPIWISNYVLMNYGDGAIMGVPAHDERDFLFAKKYKINIKQVISSPKNKEFDPETWNDWYKDTKDRYIVNSGPYNGLDCQSAASTISDRLISEKLGQSKIMWRLRDWSVSRQRYWGTPIPIIHCNNCGSVPVPYNNLPVILPENLTPEGNGNPLDKNEDFINCLCPKCGAKSKRETDTMDTFIDSSWYFMRYTSFDNNNLPVDNRNEYWMPIDQYIGGIEHAVLHLLYTRFWCKVMRDMHLVKFDEPITKLLCQGMVLNHVFSRKTKNGGIEYFRPDDVETIYNENGIATNYVLKKDSSPVTYNGIGTMSKSKNNGVDPQSIIEKWGADTARLFIIFASPPEQTLEWSDAGIEGANRYLRKLWRICYNNKDNIISANSCKEKNDIDTSKNNSIQELYFNIYSLLNQSNHDYDRLQYNTIVSASMKMLNSIEHFLQTNSIIDTTCNIALSESLGIILRVLYPIAPHITWKIWNELGYKNIHGDLIDAPWPEVKEEALVINNVKIVIQINGKLRGSVTVRYNQDEEEIKKIVLEQPNILKYINNNFIKRIVLVPNKLINIVLKND